jgi:hypothetical protein
LGSKTALPVCSPLPVTEEGSLVDQTQVSAEPESKTSINVSRHRMVQRRPYQLQSLGRGTDLHLTGEEGIVLLIVGGDLLLGAIGSFHHESVVGTSSDEAGMSGGSTVFVKGVEIGLEAVGVPARVAKDGDASGSHDDGLRGALVLYLMMAVIRECIQRWNGSGWWDGMGGMGWDGMRKTIGEQAEVSVRSFGRGRHVRHV